MHACTCILKLKQNCHVFGVCGNNCTLYCEEFCMHRFTLWAPEIQDLFVYILKSTLTEKLLTHSWFLTDCLPPVGMPCQNQRYGCCSSRPGAGFLALGLCDCTNPTETFSLLVKIIAFQHSFDFNAWKSCFNIRSCYRFTSFSTHLLLDTKSEKLNFSKRNLRMISA